VFTSRELDMRQCLVQLEMSIEIIWVETFFPPVDLYSCVFYCFDKFDRVWLMVSGVLVTWTSVKQGSQSGWHVSGEETYRKNGSQGHGKRTYDIKRHVAIHHNREIRSNLLPMSFQELDILFQPNMSIRWSMR
jgi:hypothetical protein